jgi:hypothetical protein
MRRRVFIVSMFVAGLSLRAEAAARLTNFRFGIWRIASDGIFDLVEETKRIPFRLKSTGFRFGVGFDNPDRAPIEWYEIMHLPTATKKVTGNLHSEAKDVLRTKTMSSSQPSIVDDFWFDQGDPLGNHSLELFVNNALVYRVEFVVVGDS